MNMKEFRFKMLGRSIVTAAALSAGVAFAAGPYPDTVVISSTPVVVTNGPPITTVVTVTAQRSATGSDYEVLSAIPRDNEAGVRAAARQGPDALRQYVWRTRMIYSFYYGDFRPLAVG
ncbi:MAG TPA: hypothetical protein VEO36_07595 [Casimicrobiaceae bacterium]|nr:hypothetical protein [Casimicrobiaceae bacterium]